MPMAIAQSLALPLSLFDSINYSVLLLGTFQKVLNFQVSNATYFSLDMKYNAPGRV
jgi:hypothetical protein